FTFDFFFSSRRRHTRFSRDWSSDVCSSDLTNSFTSVLEEGRIHLKVSPEVSELVSITNVASTGLGQVLAVPTFTTRRVSTTVQLDRNTAVVGQESSQRQRS